MTRNSHSETEPAGQPPPAEAPAESAKPPKTAGRHIHNEITYRGVDFILNSTVSVLIAYVSARTEIGRRYFQQPVASFFKKILKPILKTPEKVTEGARWGSMFASIMVGGMAIIPPMVFLENKKNKKTISKWIDEKIYGKEKVANDPHFQEAYDAIDCEPHKDFSTGMIARGIVLAPMIGATVIPDVNTKIIQKFYNPIATISKAACKALKIAPKALMERGLIEIADGDVTKAPKFVSDWDFIHRTIGFDVGLTSIYCVAHEFVYKKLAAYRHAHGQHDNLNTPELEVTSIEDLNCKTPNNNINTINHIVRNSHGPKQKIAPEHRKTFAEAALASKTLENSELAH